jgi:hypothetical protein
MFMKKLTLFTLAISVLATFATGALAQEATNLLKNPTLKADDAGAVAPWQVPTYPFANDPTAPSKLQWSVQDVEGNRCLTISTKESIKANIWWEQTLATNGGSTYAVSGKVKVNLAKGSKYAGIQVGVYFEGPNGKWLGFQPITGIDASETWQTIKGKVTAPDDAVKMGLRLGVVFDGEVQAYFAEPSLIELTK